MSQFTTASSQPPASKKITYTHHLDSSGLVTFTETHLPDPIAEFTTLSPCPSPPPPPASPAPPNASRLRPSNLPTSRLMRDLLLARHPILLTAPNTAARGSTSRLGTPPRAPATAQGTIDRSMRRGCPEIWEDGEGMSAYAKEVCEAREIRGSGQRLGRLREIRSRERERVLGEAAARAAAAAEAAWKTEGEWRMERAVREQGGEEVGKKEGGGDGVERVDSMAVLEGLRRWDGASHCGEEA